MTDIKSTLRSAIPQGTAIDERIKAAALRDTVDQIYTSAPSASFTAATAGEDMESSGDDSLVPETFLESPLTTKGDIWTYDTADQRLPVGTNGQVINADSGEATGLKWNTPPFAVSGPNISPATAGNDLLMNNGETITGQQTTASDTDGKLALKQTGDSVSRLAIGTTGALNWGGGSGAADVKMHRASSNILRIDDTLQADDYLGVNEVPSNSVAQAPSGYHYYSANSNRPRSLSDVAGAPSFDLGVQEQETFQGNALALGAEGQTWKQEQHASAVVGAPITPTPYFTHNSSTHQSSSMGIWAWNGSYNPEMIQSNLITGVAIPNFSACNKINVTISFQTSAATNFDAARLYICDRDAVNSPLTSALTLSTYTWDIATATFDITSWTMGADNSLLVGVEFIGKTLASKDTSSNTVYIEYLAVDGYAV